MSFRFECHADTDRNVLYVTQIGLADAAGYAAFKAQYEVWLKVMRKGFTLVNDQRKLEGISDEAMELARTLVRMTNDHAARVIRIVPADLLTKVRLTRVLVEGDCSYEELRVATPEEAERLLAAPESPGGHDP